MRGWTRWAALLGVFLGPAAHAQDSWWAADKALHFGVSAAIPPVAFVTSGLFLEGTGPRLAFGAVVGLSAGGLKELWDLAGHGDPSWKDFTWDAIGVGCGVGLTWLVDRLVSSPRGHPAHAAAVSAGPPSGSRLELLPAAGPGGIGLTLRLQLP